MLSHTMSERPLGMVLHKSDWVKYVHWNTMYVYIDDDLMPMM